MATGIGQTAAALKLLDSIQAKPYQYRLFAALRYLECAYPNSPRLGSALSPRHDKVRLHQPPFLTFAASSIERYQVGIGQDYDHLYSYSFGLFGPHGALPLHITEFVCERKIQADDITPEKFIDLFHHRMQSFYYRAWAQAEPTVEQDRPEKSDFNSYIGSLSGHGVAESLQRDAMPDKSKHYYAGVLSAGHNNKESLASLLSAFFSLQFVVKQFVKRWVKLEKNDRCVIKQVNDSFAQKHSAILGKNSILGDKVISAQNNIDIVCGPLTAQQFKKFLPTDTVYLKKLVAVIRNYLGDFVDWKLTLQLKFKDRPTTQLRQESYLGWNTWIGNKPVTESSKARVTINPQRYTKGWR